jgi:hypothetical protein
MSFIFLFAAMEDVERNDMTADIQNQYSPVTEPDTTGIKACRTEEQLADMLYEVQNYSDAKAAAKVLWPIVRGAAQTLDLTHRRALEFYAGGGIGANPSSIARGDCDLGDISEALTNDAGEVARHALAAIAATSATMALTSELMNATTVSCSGLDITIACDDHDTKDAIMNALTDTAYAAALAPGNGAVEADETDHIDWDILAENRLGQRPRSEHGRHIPQMSPAPGCDSGSPSPASNGEPATVEALKHALARFECLAEQFEETGDTASWAMCSVDADRMRRALIGQPSSNGEAVEAVLKHYAETFCEGFCERDPQLAKFDHDCSGCLARRALAGSVTSTDGTQA